MKIRGWQIWYTVEKYDDEDWCSNSYHYENHMYSNTIYEDKNIANKEILKIDKNSIYVGGGLTESHVTDIYLKEMEFDFVK